MKKLPWYDEALIILSIFFVIIAVINYLTLTNIQRSSYIASNLTTNSSNGGNQFFTLNLIYTLKPNSSKTQTFSIPKNFCLYHMFVTPINDFVGTGTLNATMKENSNVYLDNFNCFTGAETGLDTNVSITSTDFSDLNASCHIKNGSPKLTLTSTYANDLQVAVSITLATISTFYEFTPI